MPQPTLPAVDAVLMSDMLELAILPCQPSIKKFSRMPVSPCAGLHSAVLAQADNFPTPQAPGRPQVTGSPCSSCPHRPGSTPPATLTPPIHALQSRDGHRQPLSKTSRAPNGQVPLRSHAIPTQCLQLPGPRLSSIIALDHRPHRQPCVDRALRPWPSAAPFAVRLQRPVLERHGVLLWQIQGEFECCQYCVR